MENELFSQPRYISGGRPEDAQINGLISSLITGIWSPALEKHIVSAEELRSFCGLLAEKLAAIPEDKLISPDTGMLWSVLDSAKYFSRFPEMSGLFAALAASCLHRDYAERVHPSFASVACQLSEQDIKVLRVFRPKIMITEVGMRDDPSDMVYLDPTVTPFYMRQTFPIINYALYTKDEQKHTVANNVFYELPDFTDVFQVSACIGNLSRLGLIGVTFLESLYDDDDYMKFTEHEFCLMLRSFAIGDGGKNTRRQKQYIQLGGQRIAAGAYERLEIEKGCARLTDYGLAFTDVCFSM